jgi:hypothetical protein
MNTKWEEAYHSQWTECSEFFVLLIDAQTIWTLFAQTIIEAITLAIACFRKHASKYALTSPLV